MSWAFDGGIVASNPFLRAGSLYHGTRADMVWTLEQQAQFLASAPEKLHLPFMMAVWLGQRQGDLLKLAWNAYDGQHIRLRQSKTGKRVTIKVGAALKLMLDATPKISPPDPDERRHPVDRLCLPKRMETSLQEGWHHRGKIQ